MLVLKRIPCFKAIQPFHRNFRAGDMRHSLADIGQAKKLLGYLPTHRVIEGLGEAMAWCFAFSTWNKSDHGQRWTSIKIEPVFLFGYLDI